MNFKIRRNFKPKLVMDEKSLRSNYGTYLFSLGEKKIFKLSSNKYGPRRPIGGHRGPRSLSEKCRRAPERRRSRSFTVLKERGKEKG